jgi:hypothetical protein
MRQSLDRTRLRVCPTQRHDNDVMGLVMGMVLCVHKVLNEPYRFLKSTCTSVQECPTNRVVGTRVFQLRTGVKRYKVRYSKGKSMKMKLKVNF